MTTENISHLFEDHNKVWQTGFQSNVSVTKKKKLSFVIIIIIFQNKYHFRKKYIFVSKSSLKKLRQ